MREIALNPIEDVLEKINQTFTNFKADVEEISLLESEGRQLAKTIFSNMTIPQYRKSTVDGYAICHSKQSQTLKLVDALTIENPRVTRVDQHCIYVPTGGRVPYGADVMVKIEETTQEGDYINFNPYPEPENIINEGDDMDYGDVVKLERGFITAFDIGAFACLGYDRIQVYKKPTVTILSTGNELVPVKQHIKTGQTRDINGSTLSVITCKLGFEVKDVILVNDTLEELSSAVTSAEKSSDLVLISGGSSMGKCDFTHNVMKSLGTVLSDGIALKPGKPTIVGKMNDKPIIGLPGHPVSAIMALKILMKSLSKYFNLPYVEDQSIDCRLTKSIRPAKGRDTYQMVTIHQTDEGYVCQPTSGKSGMITLLTKSDGYTIIPKSVKSIEENTLVQCYLF